MKNTVSEFLSGHRPASGRKVHQVGSHVIIETDTPQHQRLSVPDHHPLRTGTLNAI
jgi:hypothetical protein